MLKNLFKSALAAALLASSALSPALAYTIDPAVYSGQKIIPERTCGGHQSPCYIRTTFNYNDSNIANGVWFATVPKNAYILAIDASVTTAFNAATTNLFTIGATKASANEVVADCATATACISNHTTTIATGISHLTTAAGLGTAITGNATYQTQLNGAVPLYAKFAQTGTAASTGVVTFVIVYTLDDDH